jgi:hypothetical protein
VIEDKICAELHALQQVGLVPNLLQILFPLNAKVLVMMNVNLIVATVNFQNIPPPISHLNLLDEDKVAHRLTVSVNGLVNAAILAHRDVLTI